ncbi:MAG: FAD-binding protein, partial [Pseudomonadota bacterium]
FRVLQVSHGWMPILFEKCEREEGYNPLKDNIEWQPAYESNKLGLRSEKDCTTSLEGLFAAGMARTLGINPFTGWSIASCTWSGYAAGESAGNHAENAPSGEIDLSDLKEKRRRFLAPLENENGEDPDALVHALQKILFPAHILIIMSEPNLRSALEKVVGLKREKLPQTKASDLRTLIKTKETQTMFLSAEMTLRAALMRKETRESIYYREDFKESDNLNWLKWIIVEKGKDGEMHFSTEDIPFDRYKFRP